MGRLPELLAPAGDWEKLQIAFQYGADAVYCAGKVFGMRAGAGNLSPEELERAVELARQLGKRVYVTVNIIPHNEELEKLPQYLTYLGSIGVDGLIASDPGVIAMAQELVPDLPLHLSTQANAVNWRSVLFWQDLGIKRVVLARELSRKEIAEIKARTKVELEVFVHGAMCMAYSGRCLISMYLTGRDANRGDCAQPCRWRYGVVEEKRPGEFLPVVENEGGTAIFNSKDLCLLGQIPQLVDLGLSSLKLEGRMKGIHYVATVTQVYRQALDAYATDPDNFQLLPQWEAELAKVSHREYTTGFFLNKPTTGDHSYGPTGYVRSHDFVAVVREYDGKRGMALVEQRNPFAKGDILEVFGPGNEAFLFRVEWLTDCEGEEQDTAPHPQQWVWINVPHAVAPLDLVRRVQK